MDNKMIARELMKLAKQLSARSKYMLDVTYEIVTSESAEYGEAAESGFEDEDIEFDSLYEMIEYMLDNGAIHPSSSSAGANTWFSTEPELDYSSGEDKTLSFHIKRNSLDRNEYKIVFDSIKRGRNLAPEEE
jgi:hypothetical protein